VKLVVKTIIVILCRVSDCEELVGVTHRRWWGRDANQCFQKQEKYFWPWNGSL